jgi:hypothetical protein
MGRKRLPEEEQKETIFVRIPNWIKWELEKEGEIRKVILNILKNYVLFKKKQ